MQARGSFCFFFFSSRRRHTRCLSDWSSDVCSSDLVELLLSDLSKTKSVTKVESGPNQLLIPLFLVLPDRVEFRLHRHLGIEAGDTKQHRKGSEYLHVVIRVAESLASPCCWRKQNRPSSSARNLSERRRLGNQ